MGRVVKEAQVRRKEIVETAQSLFYSKGYEQTSIQDIIDEVNIAKGTFYHYFHSKQELLDALIDRILDQTVQSLEPLVNDDQLSAIEKFNQAFSETTYTKIEDKEVYNTLMHAYYQKDNAIMRERTKMESVRKLAPLLAQIIHQGVAEGTFVTTYPDISAEIVLQTSQHMSETVTRTFLAADGDPVIFSTIEEKFAAYEEAITRSLGAPTGSIKVADIDIYRRWFEM